MMTILLASKVFLSYVFLKGNETQLSKVGKLIWFLLQVNARAKLIFGYQAHVIS